MKTQNLTDYIAQLDIAVAKATYPLTTTRDIDDELEAEAFIEGKEQAFLNDRSILSFASNVEGTCREDVLNSTLLAQLAANKAFNADNELVEWQKKFTEVLNNLGWIVEASEFQQFDSKHSLVEIEAAIIDILTAAFGSSIIPIVMKTLNAIKNLADEDGKIKAFEKNTTSVSKGVFQIGIASQQDDIVSLQCGSFIIESKSKITRILFVKIEKNSTSMKYNSQKTILAKSSYDPVRKAIKEKLGSMRDDYITGISI